ncbi:MAG: GNAT family N-acetyltransferase [Bradymonadaceae bacterium]
MAESSDNEIAGGIEPPEESDVPAIAGLFEQDMVSLGLDVDTEALVDLAGYIVRDMHRDPPEALCWVARPGAGAEPVGVVVANFNWSLKFAGRALWIEELFVDPEARRQGLGRALVDRVVDYAETHDIRGIDLEAYQGNTPASVLYRTAGFHRLGRERFYYRVDDEEYL